MNQNNNNQVNPNQLVVQPSGDVYSGGAHIGRLLLGNEGGPDAFDQLRSLFEGHFHEREDRPEYHPEEANANPPIVPDRNNQNNLDLQPRPLGPADEHDAILALQDQQFEALQDLDVHQRIGNRVTYLNRLLVRKLELDCDEAWREFQRRSDLQFVPPSPEYCDAVHERLQRGCCSFYHYHHLDLGHCLNPSAHPINLPRTVDFQQNIFDDGTHPYSWWFNLDTMRAD